MYTYCSGISITNVSDPHYCSFKADPDPFSFKADPDPGFAKIFAFLLVLYQSFIFNFSFIFYVNFNTVLPATEI